MDICEKIIEMLENLVSENGLTESKHLWLLILIEKLINKDTSVLLNYLTYVETINSEKIVKIDRKYLKDVEKFLTGFKSITRKKL